eukprot:11308651-Ditylum_brightwellii.AAC.1
MHKWRGTSRTYKITEGNVDNLDEEERMEEEVPGSEIMQCLLDEDVQMLPGTIDAYMRECCAFAWFLKGTHNSPFDLDDYASFGKQDGHTQERQMCHTTMTDSRF